MPFPTGLLFSHSPQIASVGLYAGTAAGMGLSLALLWSYAVRRRFTAPGLSQRRARAIRLTLLLPPLVFALTIGVAFLDTTAAMFAWLLQAPLVVVRRLREKSLARENGQTAR